MLPCKQCLSGQCTKGLRCINSAPMKSLNVVDTVFWSMHKRCAMCRIDRFSLRHIRVKRSIWKSERFWPVCVKQGRSCISKPITTAKHGSPVWYLTFTSTYFKEFSSIFFWKSSSFSIPFSFNNWLIVACLWPKAAFLLFSSPLVQFHPPVTSVELHLMVQLNPSLISGLLGLVVLFHPSLTSLQLHPVVLLHLFLLQEQCCSLWELAVSLSSVKLLSCVFEE